MAKMLDLIEQMLQGKTPPPLLSLPVLHENNLRH